MTDERDSSVNNFCEYLKTWSGAQAFEKRHEMPHGALIEEAIRTPIVRSFSSSEVDWQDSPTALRSSFDFHLFVFALKKKSI